MPPIIFIVDGSNWAHEQRIILGRNVPHNTVEELAKELDRFAHRQNVIVELCLDPRPDGFSNTCLVRIYIAEKGKKGDDIAIERCHYRVHLKNRIIGVTADEELKERMRDAGVDDIVHSAEFNPGQNLQPHDGSRQEPTSPDAESLIDEFGWLAEDDYEYGVIGLELAYQMVRASWALAKDASVRAAPT